MWSTVLSYWSTVAFIDYMGQFAIQLMGFFFITVYMLICYGYTFWSPNTKRKHNRVCRDIIVNFLFRQLLSKRDHIVFLAEIFPARLRSTWHISAGAGKSEAIVGASEFLYAAQSKKAYEIDTDYPTDIVIKNSLIMLGVVNFF